MLNIFNYADPVEFIRDAWLEKKGKNPSFSLRGWSKQMGLKVHAPLQLMLQKQRPIPKKYVPHFIQSLSLSPREGLYLENLIDYSRSKSAQSKELYLIRLKELAPRGLVPMAEIDAYKVLKDPLYGAILEMTVLADFSSNPAWIRDRLQMKVTQTEVQKAIDRLLGLKLLKWEGKKLVKTHRHATSTPDLLDQGVQEFHQNVSRLASQAVITQELLEREFNSYALNIRAAALPRAKEMIRKFISEFVEEIEAAPAQGEQTYQLNVQFFGVTKTPALKQTKPRHPKRKREL